MKKTTATLLICFLLGSNISAQDASNLNITPLNFNDNRDPIELDINFHVTDPDTITSVEVILAGDANKSDAETITFSNQEFRVWGRDDLKVVICMLKVPDTLTGHCHYAEIKVIKNDGSSEVLEGLPF